MYQRKDQKLLIRDVNVKVQGTVKITQLFTFNDELMFPIRFCFHMYKDVIPNFDLNCNLKHTGILIAFTHILF